MSISMRPMHDPDDMAMRRFAQRGTKSSAPSAETEVFSTTMVKVETTVSVSTRVELSGVMPAPTQSHLHDGGARAGMAMGLGMIGQPTQTHIHYGMGQGGFAFPNLFGFFQDLLRGMLQDVFRPILEAQMEFTLHTQTLYDTRQDQTLEEHLFRQRLGDEAITYSHKGKCPFGGQPGQLAPHPLPDATRNGAGEGLVRLLPNGYADGYGMPADGPNAREISNAVHKQDGDKPNSKGASDLFWAWGQFLDHDLSLTTSGGAPFNINIPKGDARFDPDGAGDKHMEFTRSQFGYDSRWQRTQINEITPLIDGSNVYGSTASETSNLRSGTGGKLKMGPDNGLPTNPSGFHEAGDTRVNENPVLSGMHTVFAREHNRLAEAIAEQHPTWSDDQLFEAARKINVAQMQAITQNEFLPLLLGPEGAAHCNRFTGVTPQISTEFSTAAFRFGHSLVSEDLNLIDEHGNQTQIPLSQAFFNPEMIKNGGLDDVLRGAAAQSAQELDPEIVDALRDNVIEGPEAHALDLAALNIQRGRDHGLPSLNDARRGLGLEPLSGFDDPRLRDGVGDQLAEVYGSIEDVDLWTGMLAERPIGEAMTGETQSAVLTEQFNRTRAGDPNWYERAFSPADVAILNTTTLSDIIERNVADTDLQKFAMIVPDQQPKDQQPHAAILAEASDLRMVEAAPLTQDMQSFAQRIAAAAVDHIADLAAPLIAAAEADPLLEVAPDQPILAEPIPHGLKAPTEVETPFPDVVATKGKVDLGAAIDEITAGAVSSGGIVLSEVWGDAAAPVALVGKIRDTVAATITHEIDVRVQNIAQK